MDQPGEEVASAEPVVQEQSSTAGSPAPSSGVGSNTKLFLGGLSWRTTEEKLRSFFSKFGPIEDAVVMVDRATKLPRGFGFVTFKTPEAAAHAVQEGPHSIDDRLIDCRIAIPMGQQPQTNRSKKIFVGGLAPETTEEEFRAYFSAFGNVIEAQIMIDPTTNRPRGFGFVTYEDEESVQRVFAAGSLHILSGKQVEVKAATPKGSGPQPPSGSTSTSAERFSSMAGTQPGPLMRFTPGKPAGRFPTQPGYAYGAMGPQGPMPAQQPYGMQPVGPYPMPPPGYGYAYAMPSQYGGYAYGMPPHGMMPAPYPAGMVPGPPYAAPYGVYSSPQPGGAYPAGPIPMYGPVPHPAAVSTMGGPGRPGQTRPVGVLQPQMMAGGPRAMGTAVSRVTARPSVHRPIPTTAAQAQTQQMGTTTGTGPAGISAQQQQHYSAMAPAGQQP